MNRNRSPLNTECHPERKLGRHPKRSPRGFQYDLVTVQLPPDLVTALDATAAEGLDSRSAIIRQACRSYLKRAEKRLGTALTHKAATQ